MEIINRLAELGQSVWFDFIKRDIILNGELDSLIEKGVRGITSNPSIFQKAISGSNSYDEDFKSLDVSNMSVFEIYEALVKKDIKLAAEKMLPVYKKTSGLDGYVSLEVNPDLAYKTAETVEEAKRLFTELNMPNVMIKVPATKEGIPAITELISEGINVNVTLIFSVENYLEVSDAYLAGLEKFADKGGDLSKVASVASFFVSRLDTYTDKKLNELGLNEYLGKTAVANSKVAYKKFIAILNGERFNALKQKGAMPQRLLWASTSTKNPAYSDILYVQELIGENTVNTVPPATLDAFIDHGKAELTIQKGMDEAEILLNEIRSKGIDLDEITDQLQTDGVKAFSDAFHNLLDAIGKKKNEFKG